MIVTYLLLFISLSWASLTINSRASSSKSPQKSDFQVHQLPDAPALPQNWAGRLDIPGTQEGNALFFWLLDAEDKAYNDNLIIWLNGGPGSSSLVGAFLENGPLQFSGKSANPERNPYSWTRLGNVLYIDQPVGTGFASEKVPVRSNKQLTSDLFEWLVAFDAVFDRILQKKKVHIVGESYAGIYVPYIANEVMNRRSELPMNLVSISIGDGTIGTNTGMSSLGIMEFMQEHALKLKIPRDIMEAFSYGDHVCGFDAVRQQAKVYPPKGHFYVPKGSPLQNATDSNSMMRGDVEEGSDQCNIHPDTPDKIKMSIFNSTCYGQCAVFDTAADYLDMRKCFSVYNLNYDCTSVNPTPALEKYLSRADVQVALNVLRPKSTPFPFKSLNRDILARLMAPSNRPTPPSYSILPDLLTTHRLPIHIYQGRLDLLINHVGVEITVQNMTWNGAQGFQKPLRMEFGRRFGSKAVGLWNEERGLSYHLFHDGGHLLPFDLPKEIFQYVKEVILKR